MIEKIINYVDYIFGINKITDLELKEEVTSNLIERYNDYINKGIKEEDAYLKTIKSMGDFNLKQEVIENKFDYKPNWASISLWISLGLAVISTISLLLSISLSIFLIAVSISLHIGASYYLYHLSQYVMKEEKDVVKHNTLLKEIFTNLKVVFVFWNINISYFIAAILNSLITPIVLLNFVGYDSYDQLIVVLLISTISFTASFIVLFYMFRLIYKSLVDKYFELTNTTELSNMIKENKIFKKIKFSKDNKLINFISKIKISSVLIIIFGLFILFQRNYTVFTTIVEPGITARHGYRAMFFDSYFKGPIKFALLGLTLIGFMFSVLSIVKEKKRWISNYIALIIFVISHVLIYFYLTELQEYVVTYSKFNIFLGIVGILLIILLPVGRKIMNKEKNESIL